MPPVKLSTLQIPKLPEPFPNTERYWKDPKTGLMVPKNELENLEWRSELLANAETDDVLQNDLLSACKESLLFFINAFGWTFHQHEVDPVTGQRLEALNPHVPFLTWEVQDRLFNKFEWCLANGKSILIDKCRDMGASWCCVYFLHWLWLFRKDAKLLEMSRTKDYVDLTGNHKALFQKHDYVNVWLPDWMRPPACLPDEKYRTSMHIHNVLTSGTLDGESTTPHAGSGDRRLVALLDEFSKVEHGSKMRSATRDVALMRIVNSTPAGPGTEYSKWKTDGTIEVFTMDFWEHPQKGAGRYVERNEKTNSFMIRSPWFNEEEKVRSPKELAQEVLRKDLESGDTFFSHDSIKTHRMIFGSEPLHRFNISLKSEIPDSDVPSVIQRKSYEAISIHRAKEGDLRVWCELFAMRPDQSKSYIIGGDIGKGQGASNSVLSVKCRETKEKVAEWRSAQYPPHEMARIAIAIALWVGGRKPSGLPLLKWEMNGPGWDFGRQIVKIYAYPFYYKNRKIGVVNQPANQTNVSYGWHSSADAKLELLTRYDRALAHGGYVNHSLFALDEALTYIYLPDGGIGPAGLIEESKSARKTHGDCVIADALSLDDDDAPADTQNIKIRAPERSCGYRMEKILEKKKNSGKIRWKMNYDFRKSS
jgi:hypothetical protein